MFYALIARCLNIFVRKPRLKGLQNIRKEEPSVYAANHLGYYSPLMLMLHSGVAPIPWVNYEIMEKNSCKEYLRLDFVEPTLHLKGIIARITATVLAPCCILLMKKIGAVPVYHGSRKILDTINKSIEVLKTGKNLLIFPEFASRIDKISMQPFQSGFISIAEKYYRETGKRLDFYPVWVDRKRNEINFGEALSYNPESPIAKEKIRISEGLRQRISEMSCRSKELD